MSSNFFRALRSLQDLRNSVEVSKVINNTMEIAREIMSSRFLRKDCNELKPGEGPDNAHDKDKQPNVWRWKKVHSLQTAEPLERMEPGLNPEKERFWTDDKLESADFHPETYRAQEPFSPHGATREGWLCY